MKAYDKIDNVILIHTPVVIAILIDSRKLSVASLGDSRAVLSKTGKAL